MMSLASINRIPRLVVITAIYTIMVVCTLRPCLGFQAIIGSSRRTGYQIFNFSHLHSSSSSDNKNDGDDKTRILFLGTPDVAATSLKTIYEQTQTNPTCPYIIVGVVTQPPKRRKRRGKEIPSPVGLVAEELDLPYILCPEKARDVDFLDELENTVKPDLCITAAYGQYLPKRFLSIPKFGTLNIHPSLLPRWRGASPVQRSLEAGDNPVGVSVLFTVSKMDAGPIVAQETLDIDENEKLYEAFSKKVDNEYLPAILVGRTAFLPEKSFTTIDEAVSLLKNFLINN